MYGSSKGNSPQGDERSNQQSCRVFKATDPGQKKFYWCPPASMTRFSFLELNRVFFLIRSTIVFFRALVALIFRLGLLPSTAKMHGSFAGSPAATIDFPFCRSCTDDQVWVSPSLTARCKSGPVNFLCVRGASGRTFS
jgi:hypothetical protein